MGKNNISNYFDKEVSSNDKGFFKAIIIIFIIFLCYFIFFEDNSSINTISETNTNSAGNFTENIDQKDKFPELLDLKLVTFSWNYNNKQYEIEQKLYKSVYKYYKERPKSYYYTESAPPENWVEDYYGNYVKINEKDKTLSNILTSIKEKAERDDLTRDETAELMLAFVQSIPYDHELADVISDVISGKNKNRDGASKYPYEVLYEKAGTCGGKSFLAYILLSDLGYGVSLFEYEADEHLAVGIKCPLKYSTQDSGYCYAETTFPGHPIGIVPESDSDKSLDVEYSESLRESNSNIGINYPGRGKLFLKTNGYTYNKVKENLEMKNEIENLEEDTIRTKKELEKMERRIEFDEAELERMKDDMEYYKSADITFSYNRLVPEYNNLLATYKNLIDRYNSEVSTYNRKVKRLNNLLGDLYQIEKEDLLKSY